MHAVELAWGQNLVHLQSVVKSNLGYLVIMNAFTSTTLILKSFCDILLRDVYSGDNFGEVYRRIYTVGNFVLRRRVSRAVKHDFRTYIRRYTSPNDKLEYGFPHSNALFNIYTSNQVFASKH